MAIQNILSGGFYGKLGEVVGQRWKNKRTLRTYVIPFDPKTPEQLENRDQFKVAVELAQEAMAINKGSSAWKSPKTPEFSLRVKTAKLRLKNGATPEEALPLFPDGDFAPLEITLQNFEVLTETNELKFEIQNYTLNEPSKLKMSFVALNVITSLFELINFDFDKNSSSSQEIVVPFDWNYAFVDNSYILGSSIVPRFGGKQPIILYPTPVQETKPIKRETELSLISFAIQEDGLTLFFQAKDKIFFDFETKENIPYQVYDPSTQQLVNKANGELKTIGFGTFLLFLPRTEGLFFAKTANISDINFSKIIEGIPYSVKIPSQNLDYEVSPLELTLTNFERLKSDYSLHFTIGNNTTETSFTANFELSTFDLKTGQTQIIQFQKEISANLTTDISYNLNWKYALTPGSTMSLTGTAQTTPKPTQILLPSKTIIEHEPYNRYANLENVDANFNFPNFGMFFTIPYEVFFSTPIKTNQSVSSIDIISMNTSYQNIAKFEKNSSNQFLLTGELEDGRMMGNLSGVQNYSATYEDAYATIILENGKYEFPTVNTVVNLSLSNQSRKVRQQTITFTATGNTPGLALQLNFLLHVWNIESNSWQDISIKQQSNSGASFSMTLPLQAKYALRSGSKLQATAISNTSPKLTPVRIQSTNIIEDFPNERSIELKEVSKSVLSGKFEILFEADYFIQGIPTTWTDLVYYTWSNTDGDLVEKEDGVLKRLTETSYKFTGLIAPGETMENEAGITSIETEETINGVSVSIISGSVYWD